MLSGYGRPMSEVEGANTGRPRFLRVKSNLLRFGEMALSNMQQQTYWKDHTTIFGGEFENFYFCT